MGLVDEKKDDGQGDQVRKRRFSRTSSCSSRLSCAPGDELIPLNDGTHSMGSRKRTVSGRSVVSRTISLAEYHEDLKPALKHKLTRNLAILCFTIYFGSSFLFGYNIGVLNQPSDLIKSFYNETYTNRYGEVSAPIITLLWSFTTAIFFPGGMIGAFSSGYLTRKIGRRKAIMVSHIPGFIGATLQSVCVAAKSPELLIVGRFVTGISCGIAAQMAPMFISEIAPFNLRGALGTGHQLFITIGIFWGSLLGLRQILCTESLWVWLLAFNALPALIGLIMIFFLPDSPRYLMLEVKDRIGAEKALRWLRQTEDVSVDMEEMETEANESKEDNPKEEETYTMMRLLTERTLLVPLLITVILQVAQQFSGINAIFFYSTGIFVNAGVEKEYIQYAVVITNLVNVGMTFVAVALMDRVGRRPLLLYPMIVMVFDLGLITLALNLQSTYSWMAYLSIACVIIYVICFAIGLGPIPWMMAPELFRQGPRSMAMSIAGVTNWLCTTIVAISFESIQEAIKEFTFVLFLVLMIGFTVFVYFKAPETKNKTFEEIASLFQPGGVIEVEEFVDDEPVEKTCNETDDYFKVGGKGKNGSVGSANDVTINMNKSEDRQSLTKSMENMNTVSDNPAV